MQKLLILALTLSITVACAFGEDLSIQQIQYTELLSGDSPYKDSTVWTGGIVTGVNYATDQLRYFIADRSGGLWSGILVVDNLYRNRSIGDSVHFQAKVTESSSQTRLRDIVVGTFSYVVQSGIVPAIVVQSGSIGESAEGVLIELRNVSVTGLGTNQFTINDGSGPLTVGRHPNGGWTYTYEPQLNDQLSFIRGIITAVGSTYTLNPRDDMDFGFVGNRPPLISNVTNTPLEPINLQADTITATLVDETGVEWSTIYYRFGETGDFRTQSMYDDGLHGDGAANDGRWGGIIPSGPARSICYYYIIAADSLNAQAISPSNAPATTYRYVIRSSVLAIFDLQYTGNPTGGASPYDGQSVTVIGIVTGTEFGSYRDGFFLSDPGGGLWSGVEVYNPASTPALGDCVRISGVITEYNDLTEFDDGATVTVLGKGIIPVPLDMPIGVMRDSAEAYEGTLSQIGACVVSNVSSWGSFKQFDVRAPNGDIGTVLANFALDYVPVLGDSFHWIRGCVTYNSTPKWMVAPRGDADLGYIDHRPPRVISVETVTDTTININFNERLSPEGISDISHYILIDQQDTSYPTLHIDSAYLFSTAKTIQIEVFERLTHTYRLMISAVKDTAGNVMPDTAVFVNAYEPFEYTPIADIYNNFDAYNNTTVTLRGIVNFVQDVTTSSGSRRISAFMQDESGRGLNLSQTGAAATFPGIQRGNLIIITGLANSYESNIQLGSFTSSNVTVLAENQQLIPPVVIRTGDLRTQQQLITTSSPGNWGSGTWVKTTGTIFTVAENVGGGTNITIDDGSGSCGIRIWDSMNLDSVALNGRTYMLRDLVGVYCSVEGPASMYNNSFQMLAGYAEDFSLLQDGDTTQPPSDVLSLDVPNRPFAPELGQELRIKYNAPAIGEVKLRVFDLRGRVVATLVDKNAGGPNTVKWDGRNDLREILPIGTYLLHLESTRDGNSRTVIKPAVIGTKL